MKIEVIIEKNDNELWGRIENKGNFMPVTVGNTTKEVLDNLQMLIEDYLQHEGKHDKNWNKIDPRKIRFEIAYDLQAFFQEHDFLKQSKIAAIAKVNAGLLRQYAAGVKHPSPKQTKKIETAIHKLAHELQSVSLYAAQAWA
jgi:predicted RNase H-like HicB family nuclease